MIDLTAAGLNETEAKCYTALLDQKDWKPSELAKNVGETRTNCYKILDKLVSFGLTERFDKGKILHYRASNPSRLLELARQQRSARENAEKQLELNAQELLTQYVKVHEQPGIRFFQGEAEISKIYDEYEASSGHIYYLHTPAGTDYHGSEAMNAIRAKALNSLLHRHGLTPDSPLVSADYKDWDERVQLERTWLRADDYTAPVEWGAFENKLYIISYGQEAIGMIIESEQIAEAFRQIYALVERGQHAQPYYTDLPKFISKQ